MTSNRPRADLAPELFRDQYLPLNSCVLRSCAFQPKVYAQATTDVGIAMGQGTDVAMESSDLTLVKGDLNGIVRGCRLSQATMRNIRQNLVFAFIYNALGIPIAAGVFYPIFGTLLSPMFVAVAIALSSVSVIGNALGCDGRASNQAHQ